MRLLRSECKFSCRSLSLNLAESNKPNGGKFAKGWGVCPSFTRLALIFLHLLLLGIGGCSCVSKHGRARAFNKCKRGVLLYLYTVLLPVRLLISL